MPAKMSKIVFCIVLSCVTLFGCGDDSEANIALSNCSKGASLSKGPMNPC